MDDMRSRYRVPRRDYSRPTERPPEPPIDESLRHAYRPPPPRPEPTTHVRPVAHQTAAHHQPAPAHHRAKPKKRRWLKFIAVLMILAGLAGAGWWSYPKYIVKDPFPANIQTNAGNVGISLLYPKKLPTGYTINPSSMQLTNGVLIYAANNGDTRLVFTLQKVPPSFDFTAFYKQQLPDNQQISTSFGQAVIGKNDNRYLGSLVAGDTWLLLSTNSSQVPLDNLSLVMSSLKKY